MLSGGRNRCYTWLACRWHLLVPRTLYNYYSLLDYGFTVIPCLAQHHFQREGVLAPSPADSFQSFSASFLVNLEYARTPFVVHQAFPSTPTVWGSSIRADLTATVYATHPRVRASWLEV